MTIKHNKLLNSNQHRKRRGSSRYLLFFILILLFLTGLGFGTHRLLSAAPWFNLRKVQFSGNQSIPDSLLARIVRPYLGQNLLRISTDGIAGSISQLARVESVRVRRRLLSSLRITIQERQGCLYVRSLEGDLFPIDENGVILDQYSHVYIENLPVTEVLLANSSLKAGTRIKSASLQRILATHRQIAREVPDFLPNISEYYTIDKTVYIIDARNGMRLIPGRDDLASQLSRYQFVQENGNVGSDAILDLRFADQVVVKVGH
ncbi:MAG TPA: FtsQ-type POTRA domain-containing protein [Candidatus Syntrophosphaera sp.]|nr:FtsQ-type POTRA domain-containing protein [Candidatus Syntrophosphaera sp.]